MMTGAWMAGWVLDNSSMGAHHGLCHALGGRLGIPHGVANSIMLSHVIRFNAAAVPSELARIAGSLGADADGLAAAGAVDSLREGLGLAGRLSDVGVTEDEIEDLVEIAVTSPHLARNPRPLDRADVEALYRSAL
jgi:alcohol dehydrogenase class IV